jgi:RTX calcium-binding nonapeptide repeat (4 copies)
VVIISLILPLQYSVLKFANGQMLKDSQITIHNSDSKTPVLADGQMLKDSQVMIYNSDSKTPVLADGKNTILKPTVHVSIEGTPKSDKLNGGIGNDKLYGKYGNDLLLGEAGNDKINGGIGDDKISGQGGNDIIKGEKGNDMLFGGQGNDLLYGNAGNDALDGGEGTNIMMGGRGSDTFLCNQYDTVIDFNANEADRIIGSCKGQSNEIIAISDNNNNNNAANKSPFGLSQSPLSSPTAETPSPPLNANDALPNFEHIFRVNSDNMHHVDFQSLPSLPIPLNDGDMQELEFN